MAIVAVHGYSFSYPAEEGGLGVLEDVSFFVEEGAFCVLAGPTGCGKTTLLRSLKPELVPVGERKGSIEVLGASVVADGRLVEGMSQRDSAMSVGYVMQDPDAQIVCDSVWHEIAFGLENVGVPQDAMRRRIAEVAHFFGIEPWMHSMTETLSGGQKQLVNLAGVLALRPRLLLLDEPTAQLDPNARKLFLMMLERVNRELGITVVMSTHAPEDVDRIATQRIDLGPVGSIGFRDSAREWRMRHPSSKGEGFGRSEGPMRSSCDRGADPSVCIEARDVCFRYARDASLVLRGIDVRIRRGTVHAFIGGNGCGKSTLLKAFAGVVKPQRGRIENFAKESQALLPQDPKALFVCDSVAEEVDEWRARCGYSKEDEAAMLDRFGLASFASSHPFDLSGGQQQKLAFAKLLLTGARLLFLDEPTKGLDAESAADVARIVRNLAEEGSTIVLVTHDLDFAYACADDVSMLFDGEVACTQPVEEFFSENLVYRPNAQSRLYGALR